MRSGPVMHMPRNIFSFFIRLFAATLKITSCPPPSSTYPQVTREYSLSSDGACSPTTPCLLKTVSSQQLRSTWRKHPALRHCATPASHPTLFFPVERIPLTAKHIVVDEAFPLNKAGSLAETTTWQLPQTPGTSFSPAANSWHVPVLLVTILCGNVVEDTHSAHAGSQARAAVEGGFALGHLSAKRGSGLHLIFLSQL